MTPEQLQKNITYLAAVITNVRDALQRGDGGPGTTTLSQWIDILEGRTYCPGPGETWSDVTQPIVQGGGPNANAVPGEHL